MNTKNQLVRYMWGYREMGKRTDLLNNRHAEAISTILIISTTKAAR